MSSNQHPARSGISIAGSIILLVAAVAVAVLFATRGRPVSALLGAARSPTATAPWPTVPATSTPRPTRTSTITPGPSPTPTFTLRPTSAPTATYTPTSTPTATPTPITNIVAIRKIGRLETMQYVMQTVVDIEGERDSIWERIFGTDKLLLIATGQAIAGFDLDKVAPENLIVDGQSVSLTLPQPEVFSYFVDEGETYVYQREAGIFTPLDKELETRARQLAVERLREWALEHDILDKAETAGVAQMERFLRSLGFTSVTIRVQPATSGG
jgi:hypothetical protein